MSLRGRDIQDLEHDAKLLASAQVRTYLATASACLLETRDPVAVLELLYAMWGSGHASRPDQKQAVNRVGQWLEAKIQHKPDIDIERLALELGWLRRMVTYLGGARKDEQPGDRRADIGSRPRANGSAPEKRPTFGANLDQLRKQRARYMELAKTETASKPSKPDEPAPAPTLQRKELPARVEVRLADLQEARKAWNKAKERRKKNEERKERDKPDKERFLPVTPVDPSLRSLAGGICCSITRTAGLDELFARIAANSGKEKTFWLTVAELIAEQDRRIAPRIALSEHLL